MNNRPLKSTQEEAKPNQHSFFRTPGVAKSFAIGLWWGLLAPFAAIRTGNPFTGLLITLGTGTAWAKPANNSNTLLSFFSGYSLGCVASALFLTKDANHDAQSSPRATM